jgi:hypothetical protein
MEKMTLVKACQSFLTLPGEQLKLEDYKKLTPTDKADLTRHFAAIGIDTTPASTQTSQA